MRYIQELKEGAAVKDVYLCKQKNAATTKNGKEYYNVILQDKTGTIDAKIWDTGSFGIAEFEAHDYVFINGEVTSFNGALQVNIRQAPEPMCSRIRRKVREYRSRHPWTQCPVQRK